MRTLAAELRLSGRAGNVRVRGRVLAGLADPGAVRLEGVAPFGPPAFILVARPGRAALVLPRESRALVGPPPADMVHALAGVSLTPDDLRHVLSGCVPETVRPVGGRRYGPDWSVIDTNDGGMIYVRRIDDASRIVAVRRGGLLSEYDELAERVPGRVRLTSTSPASSVELTVTVSQVRINTTLDAAVFAIEIPPDAVPLTLDELRARGPLRETGSAR